MMIQRGALIVAAILVSALILANFAPLVITSTSLAQANLPPPAVELVGGRITQDTTWSRNKHYELTDSLIINPGVTLTIEPGVLITIPAGQFIRVEGTLLARGTVDQPIRFTTSSASNERWSALQFSDGAVAASFDRGGNYSSGSILEHVELSSAETGLNLGASAPYVVDVSFRNNGTAINAGASEPRILRSNFQDGATGISLNGGAQIEESSFQNLEHAISGSGSPLIRANRLSQSGIPISLVGDPQIRDNQIEANRDTAVIVSGSPTITGNRIVRNGGSAIILGGWGLAPRIRENVITGNGAGIIASGLQLVDIQQNLIAGNDGTGLALEVSRSGATQEAPVLVYNPDTADYLLAWRESATLKAQRLSDTGQPLGEVTTIATQGVNDLRLVYQPTQQRYLLAWSDGSDVRGRFLANDGQPQGSELILSSQGSGQLRLVYLPNSDRFMLAVEASGAIVLQRLGSDATPLGSPLNTNESSSATLGDLALDPASDRVLLTFAVGTQVHGAWVGPESLLLVPELLGENGQGGSPAAHFNPTGQSYQLLWGAGSLLGQTIAASATLPLATLRTTGGTTALATMDWVTQTITATASQASTRLRLTSLTPADAGPAIDALRVEPVAPTTEEEVALDAGAWHTCAITNFGSLRCWGIWGSAPSDIGPVKQVSAAVISTCVVTPADSLRCWGYNGLADIPSDLGTVSQVSAGGSHTCAITTDGKLRCWGNNDFGQSDVPSDLGMVSQVSVGNNHSCAITTSGSLRCWGYNTYGQIDVPSDLGTVSQVSVGWEHTCVVTASGSLRCWGYNLYGQSDVPNDLGLVDQVSANGYHTCVVTESGSLRCWGYNDYGQIDVPSDLGSVSQVSAGGNHTCAITTDGNLRCWGRNDFDQNDVPGDLSSLLANGDLELPLIDVGTDSIYTAPQGFDGWSLLAGSVSLHAQGEATDGRQWLALNGSGPGAIAQDIPTSPGTTYSITLALASEPGGDTRPGQLELSWGSPPLSPTVVFSSRDQIIVPYLVGGGNGELLGSWSSSANLLYAQRLDSSGTPILTPTLVAEAPVGRVTLAYNPARNDYLLIWPDGRSGSWRLWAQRLSASGALLGESRSLLVEESGTDGNSPMNADLKVHSNTIIDNGGGGITLGGAQARYVAITQNNFSGNGGSDLSLNGDVGNNSPIDATNNFWNVDTGAIGDRVRDCHDDPGGCGSPTSVIGELIYTPHLNAAVAQAPAFASNVALNPAPVGQQTGRLTAEFSAPMDQQTIPELSFADARRGTTEVVLEEPASVMASDVQGRRWFGSSSGLRMYDGQQWRLYTSTDGLASSSISTIYGASNGDLWVAHGDGGTSMSRLRDGSWTTVALPLYGGGVASVETGTFSTCTITADGNLRCWGYSGLADIPSDLGAVSQVSVSWGHTCVVTTSGTLRCWGFNDNGQANVPGDLGTVSQVRVGDYRTCAITTSGTLRCWGLNDNGQTNVPQDLGAVSQVSLGSYHTCAITTAGTLRCWGINDYGQIDVPSDLGTVSQVSVGNGYSCAITTSGNLRCWGYSEYGQSDVPSDLGTVSQVSVSAYHTCALTTSGNLRCWGLNNFGQNDVPSDLGTVSQVSVSAYHTCVLTTSGSPRCWGLNVYGQATVPTNIAVAIQALGEDSQGRIWAGSSQGAYRYDGSEWTPFTSSAGGDSITQIVRDGQGRLWFRTAAGLSLFDGVNWTNVTTLPTNTISSLFADSKGRVWVGLGSYETIRERAYVGMYDGEEWNFIGATASGGVLTNPDCTITQFSEASDGTLWLGSSCGTWVTYDGSRWATTPLASDHLLIDSWDHHWSNQDGRLTVRWQGRDYAFTDGSWLDSTTFAAAYDFTPLVPPGSYRVSIAGAVDAKGLGAYSSNSYQFQVDFGMGVGQEPQIDRVSPSTAFNDRPIRLVVEGANFVDGSVVRLGSNNLATSFSSSSSLIAIIEAGQAAGTYDLVVVNPNGNQAGLSSAVTILNAATSTYNDLFSSNDQLWVDPLPARAGVAVNLGLFVQRSGGEQVLENIPVEFRRDSPTGVPIGRGIVGFLDPTNGVASSSGATVIFPQAGEVTIYAIIDPEGLFSEDDETNNVYQRTLIVGAAPNSGADLTPPTVDELTIIGESNSSVTSHDIAIAIRASDPDGSTVASGVRYIHMIEYVYLESIGNWVPAAQSGWLPFTQNPESYAWRLLPQPGMRYIQVRARDGAGNVSIGATRQLLNYEPATDTITDGEMRIYRYEVAEGQSFEVNLDVLSGDADLYVWSSQEGQSARVSNQPGSADEQVVIAANEVIPGIYQVEVYGYTAATYRITTTINGRPSVVPLQQGGGISQTKELPVAPQIGVKSSPDPLAGNVPPMPLTTNQRVYLPLIRR